MGCGPRSIVLAASAFICQAISLGLVSITYFLTTEYYYCTFFIRSFLTLIVFYGSKIKLQNKLLCILPQYSLSLTQLVLLIYMPKMHVSSLFSIHSPSDQLINICFILCMPKMAISITGNLTQVLLKILVQVTCAHQCVYEDRFLIGRSRDPFHLLLPADRLFPFISLMK